MSADVVGRDEELRTLRGFAERAATAAATAAVLEGEAGIGKSTLWRAGVDIAAAAGLRVLTARPLELEVGVAHAGLGDLLEDALADVLPELPRPRRHALEAALRLGDDPAASVEVGALAVAVRSVLQLLAESAPLLVAVDDVQWLDRSSSDVLAVALRRLRDARVHLLLARRLEPRAPDPALLSVLDDRPTQRLLVGPLSPGGLQQVIRERLGRALPRSTLLRVHEATAGNPLYAVELARELDPSAGPMQPLPVPRGVEEVLRARLDRLPASARAALLFVCAHGRPAVADVDEAALEPALADNVVEVAGGVVRFTHPLLASVVYAAATAEARREVHARSAGLAADPVLRARHRALATAAADRATAAALEEAASLARARGAPMVAAELGEHAARVTPSQDPGARHRRALAGARSHLAAGDPGRARVLAEELVASAPAPLARAEALALLAELLPLQPALDALEAAIAAAAEAPGLQAALYRTLAIRGRLRHGLGWAEQRARTALELAETAGDEAARAGALSALAFIRFNGGKPGALAEAERAYELGIAAGDLEQVAAARRVLGHVLTWTSQTERSRPLLEEQLREGADRDERQIANASWFLALVELQSGRWEAAEEHARRGLELELTRSSGEFFFPLGLVLLHRGRLEEAREVAERGRRFATEEGALLGGLISLRGVADHWTGDSGGALASFEAAEALADRAEWSEPSLRWWRAEAIEALLALGRTDEAESLLSGWQEAAERTGRERVLAHAARCRGLLAAARGDVDAAIVQLGDAVAAHAAAGDEFGRARALLALAGVQRRARRKRPAREALQAALDVFEALGAATWAERAREELGAISGRAPVEGLTPAERRVAALVAEGRSNREIAAVLFLGERTVASHLTRIYAKLDVRSRTELALKLQTF